MDQDLILLLFCVAVLFLMGFLLYHHQNQRIDGYSNPPSVLTNDYRFQYYTMDLDRHPRKKHDLPMKDLIHARTPFETRDDKKQQYDWHVKDLIPYLAITHPKDQSVAMWSGDIAVCMDQPYLVKSRPAQKPADCMSILFKLHSDRHFDFKIDANISKFKKKKPVIVWRGADTGHGFDSRSPPKGTRAYLLHHVSLPFLDAGLTQEEQGIHPFYRQFLRAPMSRQQMTRCKYLLSIEGNDVASNLKWALASSSIVMMCRPTVVSWFMEDHLVPWVHYIPLQNDFSDMEKRYIWAEAHPEECMVMIKNAHHFVSMFLDEKNERLLLTRIIQWYKDTFQITTTDPRRDR